MIKVDSKPRPPQILPEPAVGNKSALPYNPVGNNLSIIIDEYKHPEKRKTLLISYGLASTPFGSALLSWCDCGICALTFCDTEPEKQLQKLSRKWPAATLNHKPEPATKLAEKIFQPSQKKSTLSLFLQGTDFQIKVWQTLLHTRPGQTISYSQLAQMAGAANAQRAVGSAMAKNPIAYLIPCHRVIKKDGTLGNYGGGIQRKHNMLKWESKQ
jgi:AraC family transcriptional regulator of adaptative response/methylated-DNA-[protein]-cysteine methyltransferase